MKINVIGGGVMGLACAWRLAQRGAAVTLFESRRLGDGATGAALGALWPASPLANHPIQKLQRQSLWQFESFSDELSRFTNLTIPFMRLGRVELLNSPKAFARAQQESAVAQEEWPALIPDTAIMAPLSPQAILTLLPTLAARNHGALLCRATAQVHIASLIAALAAACRIAGVQIRENSPIGELPPAEEEITLIMTGAWTNQLIPSLPITPAKGQGISLEKPAALHLPHIVKSGTTYLVPWNNEILVGSTTEPDAGFDETSTESARQLLHANAAALFPELANARIIRHWAGLRPDAPDHQPLMGPLRNRDNTYVCAGHYKIGIALAPVVSNLMTNLILDQIVPPELSPFLPN